MAAAPAASGWLLRAWASPQISSVPRLAPPLLNRALTVCQVLLPAETTTAREPRTTEDVFGAPKPAAPRDEEDEIDVDSVFGKLKGLKTKE